MKINKEVLKNLQLCTSSYKNYLKHYESFEGSIEEFHELPEIPDSDKAWVYGTLGPKIVPAYLVEKLIEAGNADRAIAGYVLPQPHWKEHPEWVEKLIKAGKADSEIAEYVLSQPHWKEHPELVEKLIKAGKADWYIASYVLSQSHWNDSFHFKRLLGDLPFTVDNIRKSLKKKKRRSSHE